MVSAYFAAMGTSIAIYRLFFHQLRHIPGPKLAAVSKLYHVSKLGRYDNFKVLDRWHKQYGPWVRIGSTEVSILSPDGIRAAIGPGNKCTKSPFYDFSKPLLSMHSSRVIPAHDKRRRIWEKGFSGKALHSYEPRVEGHAAQLIAHLEDNLGQLIDMCAWFNNLSFDIMGDLAFGRPFNMLRDGKAHNFLGILRAAQRAIGRFSPTPWLFRILTRLPFTVHAFQEFMAWIEEQVENRKKMTFENPDIMSYLVEESLKGTDPKIERNWLCSEAHLIIVAGSDTTAATLTHLFYRLAKHPEMLAKLRAELDPVILGKPFEHRNIVNLPYLNGLVNEVLRFHAPIPSGLQRVVSPERITVDGKFVPGCTLIRTPTWTGEVFDKPWDFIPERWTDQPELVKLIDAYQPFSRGTYSCIGKGMALLSVKTTAALLATKMDVILAPGEDGDDLLNHTEDILTLYMGKLDLVFENRK